MAFDDDELDPEELELPTEDLEEDEDDLELPDEELDEDDEDELSPKNLGAQGFGIEEDEPDTY